jgi:hypothetical protein
MKNTMSNTALCIAVALLLLFAKLNYDNVKYIQTKMEELKTIILNVELKKLES